MKVTFELSQEQMGLLCGLMGITAGYTLQPLFSEMLSKLDDYGLLVYEEMVHDTYKALGDEYEVDEDEVLKRI